ncbi:hypothetical protein ACN08J_09950 (plasmid) [Pediococcus pentosaceus]|uniref:hypothetical protein n=1 Tax=Pediococcus pentosaceus TaxID=1255 RepID=UPI003AF36FEB
MKIISSYIRTFNKVIWSEKIPFLYTLVFPVLIFFGTNYEKIVNHSHTLNNVILSTSNYLAYMIVATAFNGVLLQLINFREIGFLKTYTMISGGNRRYAVWGLISSEFLFGYICVLLFSIFLTFFYPNKFIYILFVYTATYIFASIPVFLISVCGDLFPIRYNTSSTLVNILLAGMLWSSAVRGDTHTFIGELFFGLNPCDYVTQVFYVINNWFNRSFDIEVYQIAAVFCIFIFFSLIGIFSSSRVKVNSKNMRN